ncbi:FRIGIDA-like protein 5 [Cornus florida]|uniref:FRIGIDA-like protein 5 n=1 Tax=Cornus florida TaxID=4283 RepID=UPI0028A172B6|nr:FRIGIDA-like protein 5 [Cornus florida]
MASMEKISADLKLVDSKKENLREAFEHSLFLLTMQWKDLEEYFDLTRKSIEQRFDELESKEKNFNSVQLSLKERSEEHNSIQKSIEERLKELGLKEEKLNFTRLSVEERSKELDSVQELINESLNELGIKEKELGSVQKLIDQRVEEFELKEKQFEKRHKDLELKEKQFDLIQKSIENRFKELERKEKLYQERAKQLGLKEKQCEELSKSLELKEKQCVLSAKVKVEEPEYTPVDNAIYYSSSANIRFCITMDGKTLQIFLNEHLNEHDSMRDEVYAALRMSSDPAKLVLDAMQGFYPPFLKKGDKEFEGSVVRRSCTLLLAQLMRALPFITPPVREEATKLAVDWKAKMKVDSENSLVVVGFLQLVATYGLISSFDRDEILKLFEAIAQHREAPALCQALGFADKVPDLIQNFIKKKQHLVALRHICAFELVDKFPPVPLLREYLKYCGKMAYKSHNVQNRAIEERVAAVIRGIVGHDLEIKYSISNLEECIEHLIMLKDGNLCIVPASENKLTSSITDPISTKALNDAPILPKITAPTLAPVTTMALILAKMDGKRLQIFLNEHLAEHELLRNDVSTALQMSVNSAKLVLDAMRGFYPPHLKKGNMDFEACICRRSCMLLLEQLMRLSPQITPKVKEAAMKLAIEWKEKMRSETEILGFLQIVGAYRGASAFDVDELSILFGTVVHLRHAPELCQVLGFSENIPVGDVLHSQEEVDQCSSENSLLNNKVNSSSVGPQVDKSLCTNMERKEVCSSIRCSLDPAKLVLDALQGCYYSGLKKNRCPGRIVGRSSVIFLEQLMRVSPEIKPHVQEEAMNFAVAWKAGIVKSEKALKALIFLQLVAIYNLVSSFSSDELLGFLGEVGWHGQAINLFPALELVDKIPDFIQQLIKKEQRLAAIKYICAYGLVDKFPPVPLLKAHLTYSEEIANKTCKKGNNSLKAQDRAIKQEVDAIRAVIKCITDHGLESEFSPENIKTRLEQLERKIADRRIVVTHPASEAQPREQAGKKITTPTPAPSSEAQLQKEAGIKCNSSTPAPSSVAQPQKHAGKKCKALLQKKAGIKCTAPTPVPAPSSEVQPKKEAGIKWNSSTPAPSSAAQQQKQAGKKCSTPASEAKAQEKAGKKRIAPTPDTASKTQLQHQRAKKCRRTAKSTAAASMAPVGTAYPIHSAQPPPQIPTCFSSEQATLYLGPPAEYCSPACPGVSTPNTSSMSHLSWQYGFDAPANRGSMPLGSAGYHLAQPPSQVPTCCTSEQAAPYLGPPAKYCSPGVSTPNTSSVSHLNWQDGLDAPFNGGSMLLGSAGYHFGSASSFGAPSTHQLYHPWHYPQPS